MLVRVGGAQLLPADTSGRAQAGGITRATDKTAALPNNAGDPKRTHMYLRVRSVCFHKEITQGLDNGEVYLSKDLGESRQEPRKAETAMSQEALMARMK